MAVTKITKRDGSVVEFNQAKIWKAISKAFLDINQNFTAEEAKQVDGVTESVVHTLDEQFVDNFPAIYFFSLAYCHRHLSNDYYH